MNETDLLKLKKEINTATGKAAELKGQRTLLDKQLKEKWGVNSPKEGKARLKKMQESIDAKDLEIQEATEELEKQLEDEEHNTND